MTYGSTAWNKNSEQIDSAIMFVHDKRSDKMAKITLEETAPDSSIFQGQYSLSWTGDLAEPEIYIPPQNLRNDPKAEAKYHALMKDKKVTPQPLLIRQEGNVAEYDVFDTNDQLAKAQKAYEQEKDAKNKSDQSKLVKPQASDAALQVAQMTAQQIMMAKLAKDAANKEADRLRLQQIEQQKMDQERKSMAKLAAADQAKRRAQAAALGQQALAHYSKGEYAQAEAPFKQSTELDPDNRSYHFQYGVTLYRLDKLTEALVILETAKVDGQTELEKKYYMGLIHYKLKEFAQAKDMFGQVKGSKNPTLAPSAAFYEGLIYLSEENYKAAQASFEFVIDNSSDAVMDKKSEEYIEQIAALIAAKKMAAKKWILDASAGLNYDSNVLLLPNLSQSTPSNAGGVRASGSANVERRLFYKDTSDMSVKVATMYLYSFDSKFTSADPAGLTLTAPFSLKGTMGKRGYKFTATPGYDTIYMDYNSSGSRQELVNSMTGDFDLMLVMNERWFSSYNFNVRDDKSKMPSAVDQDMSAIKYTFKKMETLFVDESKKRALIGYVDFVDNIAVGSQQRYTKVDLGVIYSAPIERFKNMTWNTALTTYVMSYPNYLGNGNRKDTDLSLALGVSKVLSERWTWANNASYTNNASNEAAFGYDKYSLTTTMSFNWDDAPKD